MSEEHGHEHAHHAVNYTAIFVLLCVCTGMSWILDESKSLMTKPTLIVLVFAVAICKATFVLLYFMHIKFERAWKYVLLAPTAVLACALPFALAPDISFHYYTVVAPQQVASAAEEEIKKEAAGHPAGDHSAAGQHADAPHEHKDGKPAEAHKTDHPAGEKAHKAEKPHK